MFCISGHWFRPLYYCFYYITFLMLFLVFFEGDKNGIFASENNPFRRENNSFRTL